MMNIEDLIQKGRKIEQGLSYVNSPEGVIRMYDVYRPSDMDEYYRWKEQSIRFLQLYYPTDFDRFIKYAEEFEKHHYLPCYISNMVGVLDACDALPSEKMRQMNRVQERDVEIAAVEHLEQEYLSIRNLGNASNNKKRGSEAFRKWHAAACVLFDKWIYAVDEDWIKFQTIDEGGNFYTLSTEYGSIYSSYQKLMARLKEGRNLKGNPVPSQTSLPTKKASTDAKINIFISYSHADKKWLERLKKHLKVLSKYSGDVDYWVDTKLRGGDRWREEITKAINNANVVILLVSTDFLASDFITSDELPPILRKAQEDGTRILPLIVAPCEYGDSELQGFQAVNDPDRTLADLGTDEAAIERVFMELNKNIKSLI